MVVGWLVGPGGEGGKFRWIAVGEKEGGRRTGRGGRARLLGRFRHVIWDRNIRERI